MKKMYFFLVALFCVLINPALNAQSADALEAALISSSDVDVTIVNDATYPWVPSADTTYITNGNLGHAYTSSTISISYTSERSTEVMVDWLRDYDTYKSSGGDYYYSNTLQLYIDGVKKATCSNSSYSTPRYYLPAGEHIITFYDTIWNAGADNYSRIKNLSIRELLPLETEVLTDKSKPLTFTTPCIPEKNIFPWTTEDGYIQNGNYGFGPSSSSFFTTFSVDTPSILSFESSSVGTSSDHYLWCSINGVFWKDLSNTGYKTEKIFIPAGEYTILWKDTIYSNSNDVNEYKAQIRNIEVTDILSLDWTEVELEYAGTLGVEVLYKVDVLTDVVFLKIKGNLNETDWGYIDQMRNLVGLDLSEANFTSVPNSAFNGSTLLQYIKLPESVTSIGDYAFRKTQIFSIDIPASVTSIGQEAFASTCLRHINFPANSQLTTIGYQAFYGCTQLVEFIMPNTVTTLQTYSSNGARTFYDCTRLNKLHFSNSLKTIEERTCYNCNLKEVKLPENISSINKYAFYDNPNLRSIRFPESLYHIYEDAFAYCGLDSVILPIHLSYLGSYAFSHCDNLTYVELPQYIRSRYNGTYYDGYYYNFYNSNAINKVVCKSATPPDVTNSPFSATKSNITLVVPSFAVVSYKLHSYWYQFGSIEEGEPLDYWEITDDLMLTNNRRMEGTPDIEIATNGRLTAAGAAPFPINRFMLNFSSSSTSALLNNCKDMYADSVISYYYLNAKDTWYFIVPLYDIDLTRVVHQGGAPFVFRYYDAASRAANGTGSSWKNVTDSVLRHGEGYIIRSNATGRMTLPPVDSLSAAQVFHTEDVTIPLNEQTSDYTANAHWNYVGNPYPCYYDIWYMDFPAPITVWTGSTYKAYSLADDSYALRPMEAFFVQKPDEISEITFHKEGRQVNSDITHTANAPQRRNAVGTQRDVFNITITAANGLSDDTRVVINEQAQRTYEIHCDASKFMSMDAACPQIYTLDDQSTPLAINERPRHEGVVRAGFYAAAAGEYTITAGGAEGILIRDLDRQITHNLEVADYRFTVTEAGLCDTRFEFIFTEKQPVVTDIEDTYAALQISNQNGVLTIKNAPADVLIYTVDGRLIEHAAADNTIHFTLQPGVYVVQVGNVMSKQIIH